MFKKRKRDGEGEVEANLIPVLSTMFLLIPSLLLAMEIAPFTAIVVHPPKFCDLADPTTQQPDTEPLAFRVHVRADGFTARYGSSPESERTIDIPTAGDGGHDYAALEARAAELKARFPEDVRVTISAEGGVEYQTLVQSMDALRGHECSLAGVLVGEGESAGCYFWDVIVESSTV